MVAVFLLAFISVNLFLQIRGEKTHPAKIYSDTEVLEGGKLEITCSTFGYSATDVYLYLCKNGKAIDMKKQRNQQDAIFRIERIDNSHSGNYSCVFSEEQLETTQVMGYGDNCIFINVIESLVRAQISLLKSEVTEGSDAVFSCKTSNLYSHISQSRSMILAYLSRNGTAVEVNIWDATKMETTFTLRNIRLDDVGSYSCVVMLNMLPYHEQRLCGNNEVNLMITASDSGTEKIRAVIVCSGVLFLLCLFLGIGAVIRKQGCAGCHSERPLQNEEELREPEVVYEDAAEATGEIQSMACSVPEWEEFSDSDEEEPHLYQLNEDP